MHSSKECRIWLLDTSALGGEDHRTPVYRTPLVCNEEVQFAAAGPWGALSTWEDTDGTRWMLMPFWGPKHSKFKAEREYGEVVKGAIAAFKLEPKNGKLQLTPAWLSRNINQADPGRHRQRRRLRVRQRRGRGAVDRRHRLWPITAGRTARRTPTHAELHAFDARTGDELWSSGDQIASFNHFTSLSIANGRVYIGTFDGMLYSFGVDKTAGTR